MKRIIRILAALLVIAALAAGGVWYYRNHTATASASAKATTYTQVVKVTQGNLSSTVSVVGQLEAQQSASLSFTKMASTAKLATLAIKTGATITTGQVLAAIDPATYKLAVDQAKSDLQAATKKLADLKTPATALQIAQADVSAARAVQTLAQANADLADIVKPDLSNLEKAVADAQDNLTILRTQIAMAEHDSLAKSERDLSYTVAWYERRIAELQVLKAPNLEQTNELANDQALLVAARADLARVQVERDLARKAKAAEEIKDKVTLATAQDALAAAKAGGDKLALAKAQVSVTEAKVTLQGAQQAQADLIAGSDATTIAAAQADVDKKTLTLSDVEAALAGATLTAPFNGTVLKTSFNVGDQVSAASVIMTVADLKTLRVTASIDETTIRQISAGQTAVITFDAYPSQQFQGKVLEVPLQGSLQGGIMVYPVPISLTGAEKLSLLVGMTANVKIQAGSVTNALLIPTLALTKANGQYQVKVPNTTNAAGAPETAPVEVGLSNGTYTQITKGLNVGDEVIVNMTKSTTSTSRNGGASGIFGMFGIR